MSSLNQKSSISNPFNISSDSFKFSLDFNHSIPDIMNSNNEHIMKDSNAFVSNNSCNYQSTEIVGERKLGGEPLKQYFNVLADATDGTNVLPLPEKIVTFGVCNVAYGENNCLSTPKTKGTQLPELSNPSTVNSTFSSTPLVHHIINNLPPSPISPKYTIHNNNSPYSSVDSNVTLTQGSRNEVSTPTSTLTINSNNNVMAAIQQQPQQNSYFVIQQHPQHHQESTCFYARRKQELKNMSSSSSSIQNGTFNDPTSVSFQFPTNQQSQVLLEQTQTQTQTNIQAGNTVMWDSTNSTNIICNNNTAYIPQILVQPNSSVQNILVQQPAQQMVYQPSIINNFNPSGLMVQQNESLQPVVVQSQVPSIASTSVAVAVNTPAIESSVNMPIQPSPQTLSHHDTGKQMVVQLQPIQNPTTSTVVCSSIDKTPIIQDIVYSPYNNYLSPTPTIQKEYESSSSTVVENNSKKEPTDWISPTALAKSIEKELTLEQECNMNSPVTLTNNIKNDPSIITPASSPVMEVSKPKEKQTIIINLADFKPISSNYENYRNNKPAVLKCIHKRNKDLLKKKYASIKIRRNSSSLYKCDICQIEYSKYHKLKSHLVKQHMTNKPYKCDYCARSFCRKNDLTRHLRIHTGDTPFYCSVCFKGFARSDACTRHVRQNLCKRNVVSYNPETGDMEIAI